MMSTTLITVGASVLVALIGGLFSYFGVVRSSKSSHDLTISEIKSEQEKQRSVIELKIEDIKGDIQRLEVKQDKHNGLVERMCRVEQRLDDLEKKG